MANKLTNIRPTDTRREGLQTFFGVFNVLRTISVVSLLNKKTHESRGNVSHKIRPKCVAQSKLDFDL